MIKNLKRLLLEIHSKPLNEQHKILDDTIQDWMIDEDQVDDIVMFAVRIS